MTSIEIFENLYNNIEGSSLSWKARNNMPKEEIEHLIYGELYFKSLIEIYNNDKIKPFLNKTSSLCDLGSGTGKIVIGSSIILENFKRFDGIELLKDLYDKSNEILQNFLKINSNLARKINFINNDFFNVKLNEYDVIFMHYPMKNAEEFYLKLEDKLKGEIRQGSIVISVIRKLVNIDIFPCIDKMKIEGDYGNVTVYYHVKV